MKPSNFAPFSFCSSIAALTAALAILSAPQAGAATITWSGGHTTGSWANSNNWGGATFANNDDVVFATGALRSLSFLAGTRFVNSITCQSGSGMANISLGSVGSAGQGGTAFNLTFRSGNTGINIVSGNTTNINIGTGGLTGGATPNSFGNVVLQGNLPVAHNGSGTLTIDQPVTGAFAVTKSGTGTLVLSGSNTFTGGMTINAGTVRLGNTGALNSTAGSENAVTFGASSTGTLALAGNSVTVANLSTNATPGTTFVQNANGSSVSNATLTVGNSTNASGTYAGTLQNGTGGGTLALSKAGTGTLTLTGSNTFTGGVTISAGRLNANNASALGSNTVAMTGASTTLSFGTGTGSVTTFSNPINVTGTATGTTLIVATTAKVSLNAAITIAADTTIQGINQDNQIGTTALGTITSSNNSNLTIAVSNSQTHVFEGKIDIGTGSVTRVAGSNANLTLSNADNSFSGGLFIGSVGGGGGGPTSGATTITTNGAQGSGDITFITGNTAPITFSNVSGTIANNIVSTGGTGGLIKSGGSTMTLTGTNTYTGATTISGGTLAVGASNVLPNGSAVSLGAATLRVGAGFTDTAGTLAVTAAAAIDLGDADSRIAFANSSAVNWTGGTLNLTGSFVSGASLRFGTDNTGLSAGQLASITATGLTGFALNGDGYLTASAPGGFSSWITGTFANGSVPGDKQGPNDDADNDGISNLVEYAVDGQDPTVPNASIGTFAANVLSFTKRAGTSGLTYAIQESTDLGIGDDWTEVSGPAYVNSTSTISYTLTPGTPAENFTRLKVTSN